MLFIKSGFFAYKGISVLVQREGEKDFPTILCVFVAPVSRSLFLFNHLPEPR
jgi:hypothetical protein